MGEKKGKGTEAPLPYDIDLVEHFLAPLEASLTNDKPINEWKSLYLGFDLGTTNSVLVALNENCEPVSAVMEYSGASVRDGVVVDYLAAIKNMQRCLDRMTARLGRKPEGIGAAAYPPGISEKTAKVCANVVEALGYECGGLYEEPTAAADALGLHDGAIVDIGGGTTGITVLQDGRVAYTDDEPTGGTHMTLVLSGAMNIDFDEAEAKKRAIAKNPQLLPMLRPVVEKMGTIVRQHLEKSGFLGKVPVVAAGGGASLPGSEEIFTNVVGCPVHLAPHPLLVTPAGIAVRLWRERNGKKD